MLEDICVERVPVRCLRAPAPTTILMGPVCFNDIRLNQPSLDEQSFLTQELRVPDAARVHNNSPLSACTMDAITSTKHRADKYSIDLLLSIASQPTNEYNRASVREGFYALASSPTFSFITCILLKNLLRVRIPIDPEKNIYGVRILESQILNLIAETKALAADLLEGGNSALAQLEKTDPTDSITVYIALLNEHGGLTEQHLAYDLFDLLCLIQKNMAHS